MIHGIGIDLVDVARMQTNIERYGDRFARRILSHMELDNYRGTNEPAYFLAKHFAAKEAVAKALGTGFRDGLSLKNISINHNRNGQPGIKCNGRASEIMNSYGIQFSHLTITDEKHYACACVVLEKVNL
ncbi:MAG: hypothetical protein HW411_15 [Gammaproteobacteria bacterium]|nr:hypothetical protein [Gammaproteobacteria bacterium]